MGPCTHCSGAFYPACSGDAVVGHAGCRSLGSQSPAGKHRKRSCGLPACCHPSLPNPAQAEMTLGDSQAPWESAEALLCREGRRTAKAFGSACLPACLPVPWLGSSRGSTLFDSSGQVKREEQKVGLRGKSEGRCIAALWLWPPAFPPSFRVGQLAPPPTPCWEGSLQAGKV
jgi:hypothetical protein